MSISAPRYIKVWTRRVTNRTECIGWEWNQTDKIWNWKNTVENENTEYRIRNLDEYYDDLDSRDEES